MPYPKSTIQATSTITATASAAGGQAQCHAANTARCAVLRCSMHRLIAARKCSRIGIDQRNGSIRESRAKRVVETIGNFEPVIFDTLLFCSPSIISVHVITPPKDLYYLSSLPR